MSSGLRIQIEADVEAAEALLPPTAPDGSGIGVNYVDLYLKGVRGELRDGGQVSCKRKGLKILLEIGANQGEALLRRLEDGPDPRAILRKALEAAALDAGARLSEEAGQLYLEVNE